MSRIVISAVVSLFLIAPAYAGPPGNAGNDTASEASTEAADHGRPAHADATSGQGFGATVSERAGGNGPHASNNGRGHGGIGGGAQDK
jgi:hypothetical protein